MEYHFETGDPFDQLRESEDRGGTELQCLEFCPICRTADVIRASAPPELREQWQSLQREALITMRSLIDHYLERVEAEPEPRVRVQDIPIE
jgi:hypothetical protein